jgi:very-short-patch-repair endonuclease
MAHIDRALFALAARQHGVTAASQLRAIGMSKSAISRRVADRRLHRVHRGVYAVGQPVRAPRGRWMAAALASGVDAVLSHRSAASLHDLLPYKPGPVEVTVPGRGRRMRPGLRVHVSARLHPDDRTIVDGIPTTSISRTLLDLAEALPPTQLRRAYEVAERLRALDLTAIHQLIERSNGRRGIPVLLALVAYDPSPAAEARSELELRFLDLVRDAGLPSPQLNVLVEGFDVDAYWPSARLVVELQSYAHHSDREAFERDHARFTALKRAGYETLGLTWRQVTEDPVGVEAVIRALLVRDRTTSADR